MSGFDLFGEVSIADTGERNLFSLANAASFAENRRSANGAINTVAPLTTPLLKGAGGMADSQRTSLAVELTAEMFSTSDVDRFWRSVDRSGGPDACWPWTLGRDRDGYGRFTIKPDGKQRHLKANRVAVALWSGRIGGLAMHSCDNPPCCNPKHLLDATQKQNREDCAAKGRTAKGDQVPRELRPRGEQHPRSALTLAQVMEIRRRYAAKESISSIARALGVPRDPVKNVVHGKTWRHV